MAHALAPAGSAEPAHPERVPAAQPDPRERAGGWRRAARTWPVAAALAAGLVLVVAFPPYDLWFLAPVGVGLLALATHRRGFWAGAGLGLLTGLSLLVPLLSWAGGYVGSVWLFLPAGEGLYFGLLGGVCALATPVVQRWRWSWPLVTGSAWVLQEALRDRMPFGGFPWGRLAFSQGDSPLLRLAALGGAPLVTFAVGAVGGLVALAVLTLRAGVPAPGVGAIASAAAIAVTAVALPVPVGGTAADQVEVAVVQGNVPRLGLEFNQQRRAVLDNHVNATLALAADVAIGRARQPDLVVWPENASDIDPIRNPDAAALIDQAAAAIKAPILVGGLLDGGGELRNVGIVWQPGTGPTQTYVKRHPVPFAEYIPIRSAVRLITTKVDLVHTDFTAGPTPGVLRLGPATVGDVICFEVAYDDIVRDTVTGGAQLLVVQTNNATFNESEALQQLAMVRLRAVEHGRAALMASTVGVSAFVDPSGAVFDATGFDVGTVISRELTLRSTRTPATVLGELPEIALVIAATGVLVTGVLMGRRRRKAGR